MTEREIQRAITTTLHSHQVIPQYGLSKTQEFLGGIVVCSCSNAISRTRFEYMAHLENEIHRAIADL